MIPQIWREFQMQRDNITYHAPNANTVPNKLMVIKS